MHEQITRNHPYQTAPGTCHYKQEHVHNEKPSWDFAASIAESSSPQQEFDDGASVAHLPASTSSVDAH
jgi:hypothetical protein